MGIVLAMTLTTLAFPQLGDRFWAAVTTDQVGEAHAELFVGPDGEVDGCTILYSDFRHDTDERLCNQLRQNSVSEPARDAQGQPIHATAIYTFRTTLGRRGTDSVLWREPALDITVNRLPPDVADQLLVGLRVIVGADGHVEACEANTRAEDAYTRAACAQLGTMAHLVRHDRQGQPVRYLTDMNVVFTAG